MYCPNCKTQNEEDCQVCLGCGEILSESSNKESNNKLGDSFLLIYILVTFSVNLISGVMSKLVASWYQPPFIYFQVFLWIIQNVTFLLIALSIKNQSLKIVGIIFSSLLMLYWIYTQLQYVMLVHEPLDFSY